VRRGIIVVIALAAAPLFADVVHLKGGGRITGEIVEQTAESVTVNIGGGNLSVGASSVVRIEKSTSPVQEFRTRAASIPPGDAEAWRELGDWAASGGQATLAGEAYSQVVAILPDDPEANRALGRVQYNGAWVTEAEAYRAQGFVEFEGEWMTPTERQSILRDREAREAADQKAWEAQMQAEAAEKREREAQEEADRRAFMTGGLPQYGDPIPWGYGPASWPVQPFSQ